MKKQFIVLLAVVSTLLAALFLAACSQPATTGAASASAEAAASASADAAASADASASADAAAASADAAASAEAAAAPADSEFKGIPTAIPADHEGRTVDMCPTCHTTGSGGAAAIPDDHFIDGELDGARNQCTTCHLPSAE